MQAVPRLCELYPDICLTIEEKARKNLIQGSRRVPVGTMETEYTEQNIHNNTQQNIRNRTEHTFWFYNSMRGLVVCTVDSSLVNPLRSSGMLRSVDLWLLTNVSVQPIGFIFKGQGVQE